MKKIALLVSICLLFYNIPLIGQNKQIIDSLQNELKKYEAKNVGHSPAIADSFKAMILYAISKEYWNGDLDSAMHYADDVLSLSKQIDYKKGISKAYNSIGVIAWYKGNFNEAAGFYQQSLAISKELNDKESIGSAFNNIGMVYQDQGNHGEALKYFIDELKLAEEIRDEDLKAEAHNLIGTVYYYQKNYPEALRNYQASLKIRNETSDKFGLTESYNNIGIIYFDQGNYNDALEYNLKALKLREEIGDKIGLADSYANIGRIYEKLGKHSEAMGYFQNELRIGEEMGNKIITGLALKNIAGSYELQNKPKDALPLLHKALLLAKETSSAELTRDTYEKLASVNGKLTNFKDAYEYEVLFKQNYDSLFNESNHKIITQLQLQYDFDKKHLADSLQFAQEMELGAIKLKEQRAFTIGGFAGLAIVALLLFFVYINYDKQRKANKLLRETQTQLIASEKMAAFGVMASRVAHEIQNPLNFINNFSELSEELIEEIFSSNYPTDKKDSADELIQNLQKIRQHGGRADAIVKRLLEHTRVGTAHEFFEES